MNKKRKMRKSVARIIIFLANTNPRFNYRAYMASKLRMDYSYLGSMLNIMEVDLQVTKRRVRGRVFYTLTKQAPLKEAKERLMEEQ